MKLPEVSILVPIYNGAAHLADTINSLLAQTFTDFELLAIDDGSTDASAEVARSFQDERVRLIQKTNSGLCETLNVGIAEARAPYIARSDQDDISRPERLERQLAVLKQHPEALGVFSYTTKFGSRHSWSNADKFAMAPDKVKEFEPVKDCTMLGSTMLMRTPALRSSGGFRQEYYPCDDWDLELRLAQTGKLLIMCEPLVAYRFHSSANTYHLFATLREKSRWTEDSYFRRLKSLPELSLEQFRHAAPQDIWTRLRHYRKDTSALHMRTAGQRYLDGRYMAGAVHLFAAAMLHPAEIVRRIRRCFGRS